MRKMTPTERREIAADAKCIERTVQSYLDGKRQSAAIVEAIERAMKARGFAPRKK